MEKWGSARLRWVHPPPESIRVVAELFFFGRSFSGGGGGGGGGKVLRQNDFRITILAEATRI